MRLPGMLAVGAAVWLVAGCAAAQGSALPGTAPGGSAKTAVGTAARTGVGAASHGDGLIAIAGVTLHTDLEAVYTMRPDGSGVRKLPLPAAMLPVTVTLSPDGKQLAIDAGNLFVIGTDGHGLRQLTPDSQNVEPVETWSPDGKWIAFREPAAGPPNPGGWPVQYSTVFAVRADGTGLHQVLTGFNVTSLAWGPGGLLAFSGTPQPAGPHWPAGQAGIWTVTMKSSNAIPVPGSIRLRGSWAPRSSSSPPPVAVDGWSPDGRSLLIYDAPHRGDLSILPAAGGRPRVLLDCPAQICTAAHYLSGAAWSPDGRTIMFTVNPDDVTGSTNVPIYTFPAAGGPLRQLHLALLRYVSGLSWQRAG